ncbi:hypothetical protein ACPYPG_19615 [Streptomyces sp. FR-108]|uniref:hypothetical protein n=1 Tax=Streptomyces sp. FR-108 TaxID=3416665 RepID=UPI003CF9E6F2
MSDTSDELGVVEVADDPDGGVAHPVPIDSPTARDGDGGTPADTLPPPLGT